MNIQTTRSGSAGNRASSSGDFSRRVWSTFKFLVCIGATGAIVNSYIYLDQQIAGVTREIRKTRMQLHDVEREIANLRGKRENFSRWEHIRKMIVLHKLDLKLPEPHQVRYISLSGRPGESASRSASARYGMK
ncbi:MAG: hypothetical protein PHS41_13160 [Victivallaceae bacterium]|nr:hypothetical protein [Victivallaceae bacterium]